MIITSDRPRGAGERVTFRPATASDIASTWAYRRLPEVTEWLPRAAPSQDAYAVAFMARPRLERTLVIEHEDRVVGDLYLHVQDAWAQAEVAEGGSAAQAEIGWVIDPAYGGRGLATDAVEALLRYCFERVGVHRVVATCHAPNEPSWRLMERVGMRRESHVRRAGLHRREGWIDGYSYAILAEEWRDRARLLRS